MPMGGSTTATNFRGPFRIKKTRVTTSAVRLIFRDSLIKTAKNSFSFGTRNLRIALRHRRPRQMYGFRLHLKGPGIFHNRVITAGIFLNGYEIRPPLGCFVKNRQQILLHKTYTLSKTVVTKTAAL